MRSVIKYLSEENFLTKYLNDVGKTFANKINGDSWKTPIKDIIKSHPEEAKLAKQVNPKLFNKINDKVSGTKSNLRSFLSGNIRNDIKKIRENAPTVRKHAPEVAKAAWHTTTPRQKTNIASRFLGGSVGKAIAGGIGKIARMTSIVPVAAAKISELEYQHLTRKPTKEDLTI